MDTRTKLIFAATEYDRRQEARPGYNPYALPQYMRAVDNIMEYVGEGTPIRQAIVWCATGRLATALLRAVGERALTHEEARGR